MTFLSFAGEFNRAKSAKAVVSGGTFRCLTVQCKRMLHNDILILKFLKLKLCRITRMSLYFAGYDNDVEGDHAVVSGGLFELKT